MKILKFDLLPKIPNSLNTAVKFDCGEIYLKYLSIGLNCDSLNKEIATNTINSIYTHFEYPLPENIYFVESPSAAVKLYQKLDNTKEIPSFVWGQHATGAIGLFLTYCELNNHILNENYVNLLTDYINNLSWVIFTDTNVICVNRLYEIHLDDKNRLHNENGPAITYRDGNDSIYSVHGVTIGKDQLLELKNNKTALFEHLQKNEKYA